jgi:hypothetical protein
MSSASSELVVVEDEDEVEGLEEKTSACFEKYP